MSESSQTEYVGQRQYGIAAPDKDLNQVSRLVTSGMYPCFGVAIYDVSSKVGLFTHLDYVEDLPIVTRNALPKLELLGANRLAVATINLDSENLGVHGRQSVVDQRRKGIDNLVEMLLKRNLLEGASWVDQGPSITALFQPHIGISSVPFEAFGLTREQIDAAYFASERLTQLAERNNGNTRVMPISCAYMPAGIVPEITQRVDVLSVPSFSSPIGLFDVKGKKPTLSSDQLDAILRNLKISKDKPI
jgi:hypothetical protein